jgi:hypothetical protein
VFVPSVADTVWVPRAEDGIVIVAEKLPVDPTVIVAGVVDCMVPSYFIVARELGENPGP